jgi:dienelactone hydrolase
VGVAPSLEGFEHGTFSALGTERDVFRRGSGPAVIVVHEVPGITPLVAAFGREVADAGFTAVLPSLFGEPGRKMSTGYVLGSVVRCCISREFATMALGKTSPIVDWLRRLAAAEHERCGGPGVGAVGMCMTGGFALGMMVDDVVKAPVLSQPSLPFPVGSKRKAAPGISDADMEAVKERVAEGTCVLGLRYEGDPMSPGDRFATLRRELGDGFIAVELPGKGHSVLTEQRDDDSVARTLDFFRERLLVDSQP